MLPASHQEKRGGQLSKKEIEKMRKFIVCMGAMIGLGLAAFGEMPAQHVVPVPADSTSVTWTVPGLQNGRLLSMQMLASTSTVTVAVNHVSTYTTGIDVTNAIETAAVASTLYAYPSYYIPPVTSYYVTNDVILTATSTALKPTWLIPGDRLTFVLSDTNQSASVIIKYAVPVN
jgi:hypothetical protein